MEHSREFYIDGAWVAPLSTSTLDVVNPATESPIAQVSLGSSADVDRAVAAARRAFPAFSRTSREERLALLDRIMAVYESRTDDLAAIVSQEMGAPRKLAAGAHVPAGLGHFRQARAVLATYEFDAPLSKSLVVREPIGVCAMITPWNWPINQIACKVAPAIAAGCTMVLKPSEVAPLNAVILAEILHEAGVPAGVFNMVHGDGPTVGAALAAHPDVDMVSFTGSTRAGVQVAKAAADSVKRVTQELGGKSANIILDDADFGRAVKSGVRHCFNNSGQSCNAPTRMLVPRTRLDEVLAIARETAEKTVVGDPTSDGVHMGPVVSALQFERVQARIAAGVAEGAELLTGGPGRPDDLPTGYFVRPTVFSNVRPEMEIAREEVFGPVLCIIPYDTEAEAVEIANASPYGLSAYVSSGDPQRAVRVARALRAGNVHVNGAPVDRSAPFGGYKQSGNGREWGVFGFEEYLETKAIVGGLLPE